MELTSNRWLGLAYKWLLPIALAAAIGVAAVTVISARSSDGNRHDRGQVFSEGDDQSGDDQSEERDCKRGTGHGKLGVRFSELAELVGTDSDGLKIALGEDKTLAEIAEENGIEAQTVIDALVARVEERIDQAVEAGKLTAEEAEAKKSDAAAKVEDVVNNGFNKENFRSWGKGRWRGHGDGLGGNIETG